MIIMKHYRHFFKLILKPNGEWSQPGFLFAEREGAQDQKQARRMPFHSCCSFLACKQDGSPFQQILTGDDRI